MELNSFVSIVRRWWWTLLVAAWIAGLAGYLVATQLAPTYEARVKLLVGPLNTDTNTLKASGQLAQTYAELITTQPLLQSVSDQIGGQVSAPDLADATRASASDVTRVLTIRVTNNDPNRARDIAAALAAALTKAAGQGTSRPEGALSLIDPAAADPTPVAPQVSLIAALAGFAGLLGALLVILLIEYFSGTLKNADEVGEQLPVPFLGVVEQSGAASRVPFVVTASPQTRAAVSYRVIAGKLPLGSLEDDEHEGAVRSILTYSVQPRDGSGGFATNLAAAIAQGGRRVILVDANDTEAEVTNMVGVGERPGLVELVTSTTQDLDGLLAQAEGVLVLPLGNAERLDTLDHVVPERLLSMLLSRSDVVIVNTSPASTSPGALLWARAVDAAVLVLRQDRTPREDAVEAVEALQLVGVPWIGTVLLHGGSTARRRRWRRGGRPSTVVAEHDSLRPAAASAGTGRPPAATRGTIVTKAEDPPRSPLVADQIVAHPSRGDSQARSGD